MKKNVPILFVAVLFSLYSCGLISDLIPDVDTTFTLTIPVDITQSSDFTEPDTITLEDSKDYSDFQNNIHGYEVNEIRFEILNSNVPDDLYFNGSILVTNEDGSITELAGTIDSYLISSIANDEEEHPVNEIADGLESIIDWLDAQGTFIVTLSYNVKNAAGSPYPIIGEGYSMDIKVIFDVTVITGVGKN